MLERGLKFSAGGREIERERERLLNSFDGGDFQMEVFGNSIY